MAPCIRAVVLHIGSAVLPCRGSERTTRRMERGLDELHALGVPIVFSSDDALDSSTLRTFHAADYLVADASAMAAHRVGLAAEMNRAPEEQALHVAEWLAQQPAIGIKHMLSLTRENHQLRASCAEGTTCMAASWLAQLFSTAQPATRRKLLARFALVGLRALLGERRRILVNRDSLSDKSPCASFFM